MTASYVGTVGWHLFNQQDGNYTNTTIAANGTYGPLLHGANGVPYYCVPDPNGNGTCAFTDPAVNPGITAAAANSIITNLNFERFNPNLGTVTDTVSTSRSFYNALELVVKKNAGHGLQFQSAFTWSKMMDLGQAVDGGDTTSTEVVPTGPTVAGCAIESCTTNNFAHLDWGPSSLDLRRNWQLSAIYHAPDIHSDALWAKALQGWWTAPILAFRSGFEFTPSLAGQPRQLASSGDTLVPNKASNFSANGDIVGKPTEWFNPTEFSLPNAGTNGNEGRNFLFGPNGRNVDWSFNKDTKVTKFLGEQGAIQFRAEIFNIFNHAAFAQPNAAVFNVPAGTAGGASLLPGQFVPFGTASPYAVLPTAGTISRTFTPSRQIQLALKFVF
jgi:hypothetical protein